MCRILTCCFCLAVCWVVDLGYAQEGASRYSPSARSHRQAPVTPRRAAPSTARSEVIELLRGAADLLDAAGEQDDAKRLRAKAVALDKKRHDLRLLEEKLAQRDALQKEIEQLRKVTGTQQQVLVHVKMLELSLSKLAECDFHFDGIDKEKLVESGFGSAMASGALDAPATRKERTGSAKSPAKETIRYGIYDRGNRIEAVIAALRETKALRVLAEPDLVTISGRPASFNVGGEFPIPAPAGSDAGVTFRKFGTQIDLVALVLGDERIRLEIRPRISELDEASAVEIDGHRIPGLRVREVTTGCELENGQSLVLAGLIQQRKVADKAPPSNLATDEEEPAKEPQTERVELIVVVTPHLVKSLHPSTTDRTANRPITADR